MKSSLNIIQTLEDYKKFLQKILCKNPEQVIEKIRPLCMKELKNKALAEMREAITKVYTINEKHRENSIPLIELLRAVQIQDDGKWGFFVFINETDIIFKTEKGDNIPLVRWSSDPYDSDGWVHNLYDHWRYPINHIREDDWFTSVAYDAIVKYIQTDFVKFVQTEALKVIKGGK